MLDRLTAALRPFVSANLSMHGATLSVPKILCLALAVFAAIGLVTLLLNRRPARRGGRNERAGNAGEARVAKRIRSLGLPALHDLYVPTRAGYTQIDHLVFLGDRIAVIETKNWQGSLSGGLRDSSWQQMLGKGTRRALGNPVAQNEHHIAALASAFGLRAAVNLVCLAGSAKPPPGTEAVATTLDGLSSRLTPTPVSPLVRSIWDRLVALDASQDKATLATQHVNRLAGPDSRWPSILFTGVAVAAGLIGFVIL